MGTLAAMFPPPIKQNLRIYQGATFKHVWTWLSGDTRNTAAPVDLTGCSARMQVREARDMAEVLLDVSTDDGRIRLGGAAGTIELYLHDEETEALRFDRGVYDLEIEFANGEKRRLFAGTVTLSPEVTRG